MVNIQNEYDYIVVGAGAGGATMAKELCKKSDKVVLLERGIRETKIGKFTDAARFYDSGFMYTNKKSKEGIILWRGILAGGSAFLSAGNMTRCMEDEFKNYGIDLANAFTEAENELQVAPIDERLISKGSRTIAKAAEALGWPMKPMRKAIDSSKCIRCGKCTYGCITGAKWTPLAYLEEAALNGLQIIYNVKVEKIQVKNGKVEGVIAKIGKGRMLIKAKKVILSAGGIGTPIILQASGIENAGNNLFVDIYVNVYGIQNAVSMEREPQMALLCESFHKDKGFIISPYLLNSKKARFIDAGIKGFKLPTANTLGLMVKIGDDNIGKVYQNGVISKKATEDDMEKIAAGVQAAKEILKQAGVSPDTFVQSKLQGAHPGGTAGIGNVVNNTFETQIKNLFVCDASVFPHSPGTPPILTIIALAKWLSLRI